MADAIDIGVKAPSQEQRDRVRRCKTAIAIAIVAAGIAALLAWNYANPDARSLINPELDVRCPPHRFHCDFPDGYGELGPPRGYLPLVAITGSGGALGFLVSLGWLTRRARIKREDEQVPRARVV